MEMLTDRQIDKKQTNEQTELMNSIMRPQVEFNSKLHQFRKEPSYDGDLSPCQV